VSSLRCGLAAVLEGALLLPGCIAFHWDRDTRFEVVPGAEVDALQPGENSVDDCLRLLGAPLWVWETAEGGRPGAVLAYGWYRADDHLFRVSFPMAQHTKANFDFERVDGSLHGLVLFFDEDWMLLRWRRGRLWDITSNIEGAPPMRRPSVEEG